MTDDKQPTDAEIEAARKRIQGTIDGFIEAMRPGALPDEAPLVAVFHAAATQDIAAFQLALRALDALARERQEDAEDEADAAAALAEPGPSVPWEQVRRELGVNIPPEHHRVLMAAACPRCGEPCYRLRATTAVRCEHPEHHGPKVVFIPRECLEIFSDAEVYAAVDWLWEHAHGCPVGKWVGDGTVTP